MALLNDRRREDAEDRAQGGFCVEDARMRQFLAGM